MNESLTIVDASGVSEDEELAALAAADVLAEAAGVLALAAAELVLVVLLVQAQSPSSITAASRRARNFFIFLPPYSFFTNTHTLLACMDAL